MGKSRGIGIEGARHLRDYWGELGLLTEQVIEDGYLVERPNYWVVRVSFLDMNGSELSRLRSAVKLSQVSAMSKHTPYSLSRLDELVKATTRGEEFRYINVAGGTRDSSSLRASIEYLKAKGLGKFVDLVPGPLFRATRGRLITHMPLAIESSYTHVMGSLKAAYEISSKMDEADLELDLEGLEKP